MKYMVILTMIFISSCQALQPRECNKTSEFRCFWDEACIPAYMKCDGKKDCRNGEDETSWFAGCKYCTGKFHCHKEPNIIHCINLRDTCDGYPDCLNGEDETYEFAKCTNKCTRNDKAAEKAGRGKCKKPCKKDSDCSSKSTKKKKKKSCVCDHECGMSCITVTKTCPPLDVNKYPNLQSIRYVRPSSETNLFEDAKEPYMYGVQAYHTCKPGYEPHPTNMRMCHGRASKKTSAWTKELVCTPSCDIKDGNAIKLYGLKCGKFCITNADCKVKEVCACDGSCGKSCVAKDVECGEAPSVPNAKIEYAGKKRNKVAHYLCIEGMYLAQGDVYRKCSGNGQWEGKPAKCERVSCTNPGPALSSMNGRVVTEATPPYYYGTTLEFACGPGQRLLGSKFRTCKGDGKWSGIDTICDDKSPTERCPHPGVPIGGALLGQGREVDFLIGKEIKFECEKGLAMVGEKIQKCLIYKQWSGGGAPQCLDPRYSDLSTDVIKKLSENTANINSAGLGRTIEITSGGRIEVYFLLDLSGSMEETHLKNLIDFSKGLVKRIARNDVAQRLRFGIVVFALKAKTMLHIIQNPIVPPTNVTKILEGIEEDYKKIRGEIQYGTDIDAALRYLHEMLMANSYELFPQDNVKRHILLLTDGAYNSGRNPIYAKQEIEAFSNASMPEFYSITASAKEQSAETRERLQKLASDRDNFIYVEDFYKLHKYIDQVTDVKEDYASCGKAGDTITRRSNKVGGKVIGGASAKENAWPWQALITLYNKDIAKNFADDHMRGGGSLINRKWVLSAAHVFVKFVGEEWEKTIAVTLGMSRRPHGKDDLKGSVRVFQPEKIILHENFDRTKEGILQEKIFTNDIALIKLGGEYIFFHGTLHPPVLPRDQTEFPGFVDFSPYIKPVCLPCSLNSCVSEVLKKEDSRGDILLNGNETPEERCKIEYDFLMRNEKVGETPVIVTGFGHNASRSSYDRSVYTPTQTLQQATIGLKDKEYCRLAVKLINQERRKKEYPKTFHGNVFSDEMICAVGVHDKETGQFADACYADSGGPLVRRVYNEYTKESCFVQVGIVSWGFGCGITGIYEGKPFRFPGYYTDVAVMLSWINETTTAYEKKHDRGIA